MHIPYTGALTTGLLQHAGQMSEECVKLRTTTCVTAKRGIVQHTQLHAAMIDLMTTFTACSLTG